MKRKVWFAGFLAALLIWAVPVWAEETITYQIDEMGVSVDIPAEFSVFTRGMDENDPLFDMYGLDKETLDTQFESSFIYLNALRGIGTEEIVVTRLGVPGIESLANIAEEQTSTVNEVYVGSDMGVEIILPEKWHQAEVGEGRELMKAKLKGYLTVENIIIKQR